MAKDWCASCQNNSRYYDDIVCVMCAWAEEDNDKLPPTNYIYKPQTNADKVRAMTDEELAEFIEHSPYPPNATCSEEGCKFDTCVDCWLDWLKQESE